MLPLFLCPKVKICIILFLLAPLQAPCLVTAYNSSSSTLIVKWSNLVKKLFQGTPIGYTITYQPVDSKNDINFERVNHTTNTTALTNLTVYTMYVIQVSAVSSGGTGPSNTVKARTGAEGDVFVYFAIRRLEI